MLERTTRHVVLFRKADRAATITASEGRLCDTRTDGCDDRDRREEQARTCVRVLKRREIDVLVSFQMGSPG